MENKLDLQLNIHNSLLGYIDKDVRAISYKYDSNKIEIFVYMDRKPNENDFEIIDKAVTEMMANDINIRKQNIEIIETHDPINKLNNYDGWIFIRYENNYF
jgi:hypothetical protein